MKQIKAQCAHFMRNFFPPLLVVLFFAVSAQLIRSPGLHYDEVLFGNAALGGIDGTFITYAFHGIPVLLMPYIGALKALIYYPIFALVGVTYESIRLPSILLGSLSLWIVYKALIKASSQRLAVVALLFLASDASLISHIRLDVGPTVLEFLLKAVALYCYIHFVKDRSWRHLMVFMSACLLGVFNKLNFIWTVNAFVAVGVLIDRKFWIAEFKLWKMRERLSAIGGLLASYAYFLVISIHFKVFAIVYSTIPFMDHIQYHGVLLQKVLGGTGLYQWVFHVPIEPALPILPFMAFIILLGVYVGWKKPSFGYLIKISIVFIGAVGAQLLLTRSATAPWHTMSLYPFPAILLAVSVVILMDYVKKHIRNTSVRYILLTLLIIPIPLSSLLTYHRYLKAYSQPVSHPYWSNKVDVLIRKVQANPGPTVSLDWGIHTQLITMTQRSNLHDHWGLLSQPLSAEQEKLYAREFLDPKRKVLFITHPTELASFPQSTKTFKALVKKNHLQLQKVGEIREGKIVYFELYKTAYTTD